MNATLKSCLSLVMILLLLSGCTAQKPVDTTASSPVAADPSDSASVPTTTPVEEPTIVPASIRWDYGYWFDDGSLYYADNQHVSTQLFTEADLPAGSYIEVGSDYVCEAATWLNFQAQAGADIQKNIVSDGVVTIDSDWWNNYGACAFNISVAEGSSKTLEDAMNEVKIMIPSDSAFHYNWNDDGVLKILTVGNSFSYDLMDHVYQIAQEVGVEKIVLGNLFYGGCRVDQHYNFWVNNEAAYTYYTNTNGTWQSKSGCSFEAAFETTDWDYISFQQSAQSKQFDPELLVNLPDLIEMAKSRCPDATILWHMPWANPHGNYGQSIEQMYEDLCKSSRVLIEPLPNVQMVIPSGTAIQNMRSSYIDPAILLNDGWHLSPDVGRYVVGLTLVKQLTGLSIDNVQWTPTERVAEIRELCIESANNAVADPYRVTQSSFTEAP